MPPLATVQSSIKEVVTQRPVSRRVLPARVQAAIRNQEDSSEILIKIIQIIIFGLWGLLYTFSPKPETQTLIAGISLVPYVLSAYLVLNIIGLLWALRRGLPHWAVYFNILIDMSMLMVLIWSFHIQYGQPPSFYLKAPTVLYVFIFIALRALRFQARFVLAAGAVAVVGWAALTAYVIMSDQSNNMITRNYVEYLTSNSVLIGAEVDKVIAILFVTGIMALAIARARALLVEAVAESTAARDLSRFFDQSVADRIRDAEQSLTAGEGARRRAAILFTDIRGFTPMSAGMEPSDVVCLLSRYQKKVVDIIQERGGTIDKFMGDGIMASFGAVAPSDTYARDALRATDAIVAETDRWFDDDELDQIAGSKVNVATAAGEVVFGVIGADDRLEYTTIGDAVNLAAKLEKCNKEMSARALTNSATLELATEQGYEAADSVETKDVYVESVREDLKLAILHPLS